MIEKNSLLNAYTALGSSISHLALLIGLLFTLKHPSEDNVYQSPNGDHVMHLFYLALITHGLATLIAIPMKFERFEESSFMQVLQMAVIFLNFWTVLMAFSVFIDFSESRELF